MQISGTTLLINSRTILCIILSCPACWKLSAQVTSPAGKITEQSRRDSITMHKLINQDTVFLNEAVILPYKNYESFKYAFINLEIDRQVENNVIVKGQIIRKQIEMGINPDMDAFANYRNKFTYNLIQPNGVVLFSTAPGKGIPLIPVIRKITRVP